MIGHCGEGIYRIEPGRKNRMTEKQLRQLAASGEFQELLRNDRQIKRLEALKYNPRDEFLSICEVLGMKLRFRHLELNLLTPAVWTYLWTIRSPYTGNIEKADELDTDIFLYLLAVDLRKLGDISPERIAGDADGFCRRNAIVWEEAKLWLTERIYFAFRPFEMLPDQQRESRGSTEIRCDMDWMTRFCSIVARETCEPVATVMFDMGLGCCCAYLIQALRRKDRKHLIYRRTDPELCKQIYEHTLLLAEQFLAGKEKAH